MIQVLPKLAQPRVQTAFFIPIAHVNLAAPLALVGCGGKYPSCEGWVGRCFWSASVPRKDRAGHGVAYHGAFLDGVIRIENSVGFYSTDRGDNRPEVQGAEAELAKAERRGFPHCALDWCILKPDPRAAKRSKIAAGGLCRMFIGVRGDSHLCFFLSERCDQP